jgi:hypothetical protein
VTESGETLDPLRQAVRLAAAETERANKLFPDEREAVYELLRRSKELPDLRKALLLMCVKNLIEREKFPSDSDDDWINVEVERAKKLHPGDEAEAITELLIRSHSFPDQLTRMVSWSAINVIAVARLPREQ